MMGSAHTLHSWACPSSDMWKAAHLQSISSINDLLPISLLSSLFTAGAPRWDWYVCVASRLPCACSRAAVHAHARPLHSLEPMLPALLGESLTPFHHLARVGGFFMIVISAEILSRWMQRELRLPLITGYLFVGSLAGPQLLGLVRVN